MDLLAIVIPYYKINFFEECLQSLTRQTDQRFKVYIGDDASPDNATSIVKKYQDYLNIKYTRFKENLGHKNLPAQWERCIELTNDEKWLMILGDDDYLSPDTVKAFYENFQYIKENSNVVRFATIVHFEDNNQFSQPYKHPVWEASHKSYYRKFSKLSRSSLSEYIFSRQSYYRNKFYHYPLGWHTDDRAWLEFAGGKPIYTINSAVVYIRNSKINISGQKNNILLKNIATMEFLKYFIKKKMYLYTKVERFKFLRAYEEFLRINNQLDMRKWLFLLLEYIRNYDSYNMRKFLGRFAVSSKLRKQ